MKVVLLDRDGTLIVDPPDERVKTEADIELFPDSVSALQKLAEHDFGVIIISNQSGISQGLITVEDFERVNAEVVRQLEASGVKILKTYLCPHSFNDHCDCRKPSPKLLLQGAKDFGFDLADTFMAGDRHSDVLAGKNAGTKTILVRTARNHQDEAPEADFQANSLTEAVEIILAQ